MSQINESAIKTPGVYVNEIPSFPPSVAQVATAIPAFIGYTEFASSNGESLINKPYKIESFTEYLSVFGGEYIIGSGDVDIVVDTAKDYALKSIDYNKRFIMFDAVRHFYDNGGSKCYIVSVGDYEDDILSGNESTTSDPGLRVGLKALEKYDEPTLILFPDAVMLDESKFYSLQQMAIEQCAKLQDRFSVFDIKENTGKSWDDNIQSFRDNIGINSLSYAATYTPWIFSTYDKEIDFLVLDGNVKDTSSAAVSLNLLAVDSSYNNLVTILKNYLSDVSNIESLIDSLRLTFPSLLDRYNSLRSTALGTVNDANVSAIFDFLNSIADVLPDLASSFNNSYLITDLNNSAVDTVSTGLGNYVTKLISIEKNTSQVGVDFPSVTFNSAIFDDYDSSGVNWITTEADVNSISAISDYAGSTDAERFIAMLSDLDSVMKGINTFIKKILTSSEAYVSSAQDNVYTNHPVISNLVRALQFDLTKIPPSGAVVGIYSSIDGKRGVWKAPANVSISSVVGPAEIIDDMTQEDLNIDVNAGKSINAIRSFTGKGTLVWGARTLDGNSNEWRYVSVRRFFIMVEESAKKATAQFVFEPNDANTWVKVRAMLENYLTNLWRQGALAGAKPEHAFFVKIGLGQTMTAQDVLEGRMIVEIGMAAVRPAEFIILRFMHKMQES